MDTNQARSEEDSSTDRGEASAGEEQGGEAETTRKKAPPKPSQKKITPGKSSARIFKTSLKRPNTMGKTKVAPELARRPKRTAALSALTSMADQIVSPVKT